MKSAKRSRRWWRFLLVPIACIAAWPVVGGAAATWFGDRVEARWVEAFGEDATFLPALTYGETNASGRQLVERARGLDIYLLDKTSRTEAANPEFLLRRATHDYVKEVVGSPDPLPPLPAAIDAGLAGQAPALSDVAQLLLQG